MSLGLYVAIGFNSILIFSLAIIQTVQAKLFAKQIMKRIVEELEIIVETKIVKYIKSNFDEVNPEKAKEYGVSASKKSLKELDKELVRYFNAMTPEERETMKTHWTLSRVRGKIAEKFVELQKQEKRD